MLRLLFLCVVASLAAATALLTSAGRTRLSPPIEAVRLPHEMTAPEEIQPALLNVTAAQFPTIKIPTIKLPGPPKKTTKQQPKPKPKPKPKPTTKTKTPTTKVSKTKVPTIKYTTFQIKPKVKYPSVKVPTLKLPTVKLPTVKLPTVKLPTVKLPTVKVPTYKVPTYKVPTIKVPTYKVATIKVPVIKVPTYKVPTFKVPTYKVPTIKVPTYKVATIKVPVIKVPTYKVPTIKIPTIKVATLKYPTIKYPSLKYPTIKVPTVKYPTFKYPTVKYPTLKTGPPIICPPPRWVCPPVEKGPFPEMPELQIQEGEMVTFGGSELGRNVGQVQLKIGPITLLPELVDWRNDRFTMIVPYVELTEPIEVHLWVVHEGGALLSDVFAEMLPGQPPTEEVVDPLPQLEDGETTALAGEDLGEQPGRVLLKTDKLSLPVTVVDWKPKQVVVTLPNMSLTESMRFELLIERANGEAAMSVAVEVVPKEAVEQPAADGESSDPDRPTDDQQGRQDDGRTFSRVST